MEKCKRCGVAPWMETDECRKCHGTGEGSSFEDDDFYGGCFECHGHGMVDDWVCDCDLEDAE